MARFDQHHGSSDGGAVLLKAADRRLGLTERLAVCLQDRRGPAKVTHELVDLLQQWVFALACGYPDCNDAARLAHDPILKLLLDRDPIQGDPLASQPTLSRFENSVGPKGLFQMGAALAGLVIEHHRDRLRGRARRITIDLDPTDDPPHGAQQLSFFNVHYDSWCYLPVLGFLSFDDEPEQYLCTAVLRPGSAPAKLGALGILERLLRRLREAFPKARFLVRLDGGFACPEILYFLDAEPKVDYVVAMVENKVLQRRARKLMGRARRLSRESQKTEHVYAGCRYAAGRWSRRCRAVIKAEVVGHPGREPKDNPHHGLEIDRTSCPSFSANQFRVRLTAAAYVLMQELRLHARNTACARARVWMLRDHLLKLGVRVQVSVRRIWLHLPASFPFVDVWQRVAFSLGAKAG